jgi:hypothetical protein
VETTLDGTIRSHPFKQNKNSPPRKERFSCHLQKAFRQTASRLRRSTPKRNA